MRKLLLIFGVLAVSGMIADEAFARRINFQASVSQVRAGCSKAGGRFEVHIDGGGYGCVKANCDSAGGTCQVQCKNNNSCTGMTPGRTAPSGTTVGSVLGSTGSVKNPAQGKPVMSPTGGGILDSEGGTGGNGMGGNGPSGMGAPVSGGMKPPSAAPVILR